MKKVKGRAVEYATFDDALVFARVLAVEGPRVSAILTKGGLFVAAPGFINADTRSGIKQVALITPDGRVWLPQASDRNY